MTATASAPRLNSLAISAAVRFALARNLDTAPVVVCTRCRWSHGDVAWPESSLHNRCELTVAEGSLALRLIDAVRIGRVTSAAVEHEHDLERLISRAEAL
jgi:Asp-tRNA(Asn)/Glu-tRNA(Gln) amidotransferase B subunit